jgi:hypothetical protein
MAALLGDPDVMIYYPAPKSRDEAVQWIDWNRGGSAPAALPRSSTRPTGPRSASPRRSGCTRKGEPRDRAGLDIVLYAANW